MKYDLSSADVAPVPSQYEAEPRFLGYSHGDMDKPYSSFFRRTLAPVQRHAVEGVAAGRRPDELAYGIDEAAVNLSRPGYEPLECGYAQNVGNKQTMVCVLTDMPGVRAEMWDWWFGWHGTETARYKLWHPNAHVFSAVGEDRSGNRELTDRQRYIDNVSYVDEYIGPVYNRLTIRFFDPRKIGFEEPAPGGTVIAARTGLSNAPLAFGWLIHQLRPTESGCEMRSRFFINDMAILPLPSQSYTGFGGRVLTSPLKGLAGPAIGRFGGLDSDVIGPSLLMHCAEEMNHLAQILPDLYEAFAGTP